MMIKVVKNIIYICISDIHLIENLNDGSNKNITHQNNDFYFIRKQI